MIAPSRSTEMLDSVSHEDTSTTFLPAQEIAYSTTEILEDREAKDLKGIFTQMRYDDRSIVTVPATRN